MFENSGNFRFDEAMSLLLLDPVKKFRPEMLIFGWKFVVMVPIVFGFSYSVGRLSGGLLVPDFTACCCCICCCFWFYCVMNIYLGVFDSQFEVVVYRVLFVKIFSTRSSSSCMRVGRFAPIGAVDLCGGYRSFCEFNKS